MTAEQKAYERIPKKEKQNEKGVKYDANYMKRVTWLMGYKEGANDHRLIPEDICVIVNLYNQHKLKFTDIQECYREVLRLFNQAKNESD